MNRQFKFRFFEYPILYGIVVFMLLSILTQFLTYERYQLLKKTDEQETISRANWIEKEFQKILNQSFSTTQTLAFLVENYGIPDNFDSIAKLLLESNKNVDVLELVDSSGVITHVYPLKGNELLGFNILQDSIGRKGALLTISRKDYFISGPIKLKQGGEGFVSRAPIFQDDTFKGFSAAVIKLPGLLEEIGITETNNQRFSYKLAKINPDKTEEVFFSSNNTSSKEAYSIPISMKQGEWKLYVHSEQKEVQEAVFIFSFLSLLLSIIGGVFVWHLLRQPTKLRKMVDEKTALLKASKEKFKNLFEQASDGIFLTDTNENFIDVNIKACQMAGYSKEEILKMRVGDLILYDSPSRHSDLVQGKTVFHERKLLHKNGTEIYVEINAKKQENGSIQAIVRDITERIEFESVKKQNLELLQASEEKYRLLINNASYGIFLLDENERFLEVNHEICAMFGASKEYFIGKHPIEFIDPKNLKKTPLKIHELQLGNSIRTIRKLVRHDKTTFFAESSLKKLSNKIYQGILHDVTESIKANELLKKSEQKYRELTERVTDALVAYDKDWNVTFANPKALEFMGQSKEAIIGKNIKTILPDIDKNENYEAFLNTMVTQKYAYYVTYYEPFGVWLENHVYPSPEGVSIFFRDITAIKKAEEEVLITKAKMEAAIRIGKIGYWSWDIEKDEVDWSDRMYAIYDVDPKTSLKYDTVLNCIHPDDKQMHQDIVAQRIKNKNNSSFSYRIVHKDKSIHYVMVQLEVITNDNNEAIKFQGNVIDITERVNAQNELKESQEKFYKSFHSNLTGKVIVDEQRTILEANETIAALLETSRENLIGKKLIEANVLNHDVHDQSEKRQLIWNKLLNQGVLLDEEFTYTLKSGKKIPALLSIEPLELENKKHFLVSAIDNTKRKEAESKLAIQNIELTKTNAELDRFVYSASHELRAPLASVLGLINIILSEEKEPGLVFKLEMMGQSVNRLDSFIKDIVQYSQNRHLEVASEKIAFQTLLQESLESLWYLENRSAINIQVNIADEASFYSDKKRISIILNNLISNAIKYHDIKGSNPTININITTTINQAKIEIKDNGIGIPKEHLTNIFKMFYRVSSKIMGTGIGLFVVKEIVEKIDGKITVASIENKGTTFTVILPNQMK